MLLDLLLNSTSEEDAMKKFFQKLDAFDPIKSCPVPEYGPTILELLAEAIKGAGWDIKDLGKFITNKDLLSETLTKLRATN